MPLYETLSYGGEKTPVVFDIGIAFTKCGFAGETGPRCIVPSQVKRPKTGKVLRLHSCSDPEELYGALVDFIHMLFFRHLLVNPKERRIVIVESILTTSAFRDTVAKVFFKHYEVPSVCFSPGHLVSLFTLGIPSGLVMDVGYSETLVIPVYEGIPIIKAWQAIPVAGKAIHNYLEAQLLETASVKLDQSTEKPLSSQMDTVDEIILEDIKMRCCFVTNLQRSKLINSVKSGGDASQAPTPPPSVDYPIDGSKILHIDGKIRENTCEVLFEMDNEEKSIATLLLDAIIQCPIDMRKTLAENIVVIGGTAQLPGFKHRLKTELLDLLQKPKYQKDLAVKTFKFHTTPSKENYTAWLGGAIFGALEVLASRSVSREQYNQSPLLPDWCSLYEPEEKEEKGTTSLSAQPSKKP